jgi:hypothetical protein
VVRLALGRGFELPHGCRSNGGSLAALLAGASMLMTEERAKFEHFPGADEPRPIRYSVDARGHVILTEGGFAVDLGPEPEASEEMARFLAGRDYGD